MLTYKIIGALTVILVSYIASLLLNKKLDISIEYYREFILLLESIESRIWAFSMKIPDAIKNTDNINRLSEIGFISDAIKDGMYSAYIKNKDVIPLEKEDKRLLEELFSILGNSLADREISMIGEYKSKLKIQTERLFEDYQKKKKINRCLIVSFTTMLVILFI